MAEYLPHEHDIYCDTAVHNRHSFVRVIECDVVSLVVRVSYDNLALPIEAEIPAWEFLSGGSMKPILTAQLLEP